MSKYFAILVGLLVFGVFFLIFDGYLKNDFGTKHPEVIAQYLARQIEMKKHAAYYLPDPPDHRD